MVWATQRLRHYVLAYPILLLAKEDPLKYILEKPVLTGRLARWQMVILQYDITFVTRKAVKGFVIAEHLSDNPLPDYQPLDVEFPDEDILFLSQTSDDTMWLGYFDGAVNSKGRSAPSKYPSHIVSSEV